MKVLQLANYYLDTPLYRSLFTALESNGVVNTVYVPIGKGDITDNSEKNVIVDPCFRFTDRLIFFSKQAKMCKGIQEGVDLDSITCMHAHTLFSSGYSAMKMKKKYGIPFITAIRNTDVNLFFERMKHLRPTGVRIMKEADKIVFLSPPYRDTVLERYVPAYLRDDISNKSVIIPNGVSDLFLSNTFDNKLSEDGCIRLIFAGEINKNKNLNDTVTACIILRKKGINCVLTAVGDIADSDCAALLAEDFVEHHPKCPHNKLIDYYRENDIFVMPSHTETFGLVYAEAMSQGLPVIYTRGQGFDGQFPEGEVGYSVSDTDPEELADTIEKVIGDYDRLSGNATRLSKRFEWNGIAREYLQIYESIGLKDN